MNQLRNVTESDAPVLRALAQRCKPLDVHTPYTYWVLCKFFSGGSFLMLGENNAPVGYITSIETENTIFVWQIGILREYRGKGYSQALVQAVSEYAVSREKNMSVSVADDNQASYHAFDRFCRRHSYSLRKSGKLSLTDLNDKAFSEKESIYDIIIREEW